MQMAKSLFLIFTFSDSYSVSAQSIVLSKSEVISRVLQHNIDLQIADETHRITEADFLQSRAMYYPNVNINYTGISTNSPLMAFGTKLNQAIVTQQDFIPDLLNNPESIQNFSLKLEVQQPILNFDKKHQREAARLSIDAVAFQKKRTEEYLAFEAEQLYMQLQLAYKSVDVIKQAIATAEVNKGHAIKSFNVGYLQNVDLLEIETQINTLRNKLLAAENQVIDISDKLHTLMNDSEYTLIQPEEELSINLAAVPMQISSGRADFLAMDTANEAYNELLMATKKSSLPRLNAFGSFETNDSSPINVGSTGYMVGAQISWNIFDGHQRSANLQRSKAQLDKARLEKEKYLSQEQSSFQKAVRMYDQASAQYETTQVAVESAEEALRIRSNRLEAGLEKPADVLMAEAKYAEQKLMEYQAIFQMNFAKLYATFLSK